MKTTVYSPSDDTIVMQPEPLELYVQLRQHDKVYEVVRGEFANEADADRFVHFWTQRMTVEGDWLIDDPFDGSLLQQGVWLHVWNSLFAACDVQLQPYGNEDLSLVWHEQGFDFEFRIIGNGNFVQRLQHIERYTAPQ